MYLAYILAFMMSVGAGISIINNSELSAKQSNVYAEAFASDMLGYRRAVIGFKNANPAFTGTVNSTQMAPHLLWGDSVTSVGVSNEITAGNLFIWYSGATTPLQAKELLNKLGGSLLVGYNRSGTLWSIHNQTVNTGITLPVSIPDNALVIVGA